MSDSLNCNNKALVFISALSAIFLIVSSCSFKTVYNNLDFLIPAYIDHMVTIDDDLSDLVDSRTLALLKWHRGDQLPKYINWLSAIKQKLLNTQTSEITHEQIILIINDFYRFWIVISNKFSLELARMLPLLNEEQVEELFESLSESNKEFISKNISPSKKDKEQLFEERLLESIEEWTGYFTDKQLIILKKSSSGFQSLSHLRLKARLEWQRETREVLTTDNASNKTKQLRLLFSKLSEKHNKLYKEINTKNNNHLATVIINLFKTLNKDQKQHILEKLDFYIEIIKDLKKQ